VRGRGPVPCGGADACNVGDERAAFVTRRCPEYPGGRYDIGWRAPPGQWGPGGGSDQTGRKIAKLLENELKVSLPVVNVPGATGNTGILKLIAGRNDGYALAVLAADTLYANQISGSQKWTLADLTPIAVMIQQPSGFYVAEGSRFKTWADVESEAKSKGVKVAISGFGSPDDVTIGFFNSKGLKLQPVPFANPGERYPIRDV